MIHSTTSQQTAANTRPRSVDTDLTGAIGQTERLANKLVDIVIPVYNEAHSLPGSIKQLHAYLRAHFPYRYTITVVDNGSSDETWHIAQTLTQDYEEVHALHLDQKGRGRALKYAWSRSKADVLAYMDVDLSTDLSALEPLVTPLLLGDASVATGSRLHKRSRVKRSLKREFISRAYNYILRCTLRFKTSDAQCGFKAIRADVAKNLLPHISDDKWFFDTELLAKASRAELTIHEVSVMWREDPDSRVRIVQTAIDDLKGIKRLRGEFSVKPRWEKIAILGILVATAILYAVGASKNGYANSFYSAAVQAGTYSWKAFFFGSLDGANYITVDKPPVALWFMEISTRIFGFHAWSMLLPEVLAGVGTVYLVYATVRRWFTAHSALLAAAVMALTPVSVLMFGFNNPDAVLTLLLTASVYTTVRALEGKHSARWLAWTAIITGFAFNTKMLQGLVVVPILALVYLVAAKPRLKTRIKHVLIAGVFLIASALWWPLAVSLTPASQRPYIGSSSNNSVWNLIMGYNGIGRLLGSMGQGGGTVQSPTTQGSNPGPGSGAQSLNATFSSPPQFSTNTTSNGGPGQATGTTTPGGNGTGPGGTGFGGSTGVFRIFNSDFGPNVAWFVPAGLIVAGFALWQRRRAVRTDIKRAAFLLWGGYAVLHIAVFSMVSGVIHPYYVIALAPGIAALIGMGVPMLVKAYRKGGRAALLLPLVVAATAITAMIVMGYQTSWLPWLRWTVLVLGLGAAMGLLTNLVQPVRTFLKVCIVSAVLACTTGPIAYALITATVTHTGSIPSAGPVGTAMQGSNNESASAETTLVTYLLKNQGSAKWIVAVASANESAPIQLSSGQPVMAVGGFNGSDNALTVDELKQLVAKGQLRYYAVASTGGGGMSSSSEILTWVKQNGAIVDYGGTSYTLYDLSQ